MNYTAEKLYGLLPAIHRIRDAEQGEPLKALMAILAREAGVVEADIARLYDNWFIETCDEWVVPYIGDLIGVRGLNPVSDATFSERARVANTIGYRRRKGTAAMLEQLARDTTGWPARAVEFFQLLATTQNYNHVRLFNVRTPDLRATNVLELLDTPFDTIPHTADVRHIADGRGKHNIPNVGLFLWRLQGYPITGGDARHIGGSPAGRYTFNPLGLEHQPLFNVPATEIDVTHLAGEIDVPAALRRRALYDELETLRQSIVDGTAHEALYFTDDPVLQITIEGQSPVPPEEIVICDLSTWKAPHHSKKYTHHLPNGHVVSKSLPIRVAVDPKLGRIAFNSPAPFPTEVLVNYAYGFSGDMGGGPYDRQSAVNALRTVDGEWPLLERVAWQAGVAKNPAPGPGLIFPTLTDAVAAWNALATQTVGVITVMDSRSYVEDLTGANAITLREGSQLLIVAADWPLVPDGIGFTTRVTGQLVADEVRPHLLGNVAVIGTAPAHSATPGELIVNGLLIQGNVAVAAGNTGSVRLQDTTVVPGTGTGEIGADATNEDLQFTMERSICHAVKFPDAVPFVTVIDSIIDEHNDVAIAARGAAATLTRSTFLGTVDVQTVEASECIFDEELRAARLQTGCVRFCYVPEHSQAPRRYRCQPDLALADVDPADLAAQAELRARIVPTFTSEHYGDPGYAQLADVTPRELREGAEDGSEMGAFSFLKQPQRETNLRASLDEYLRFGLEAGIFHVT